MVRDSREAFKTWQGVFDNFTKRLLFKLSGQRHFDELKTIISPGKEAVVFAASRGEDTVAVKIYKLETAKFTKMYGYIRVDPRYHRVPRNLRRVIFSWAEREYRNLLIAREAGLFVPTPIEQKHNVIIMEFIGHGERASPLLHKIPPEDPEVFAEECFDQVRKLTKKGFVHGDLSAFNIINHDEQPVFIDFSHMAPMEAPNSEELLKRDVKNLCKYFQDIGVACDEDAFFEELLGLWKKEHRTV